MPDMPVNFGRIRKCCYYDLTCREEKKKNAKKKVVAGCVVAGGAYATKKIFKAPITPDAITLAVNNIEIAEETKKLKTVENVVNTLSKKGATLCEENKKALNNIGITIPKGQNPLEFLKRHQVIMAENIDTKNPNTINYKIALLNDFIKKDKSVNVEPTDKLGKKITDAVKRNTQEVLENLKKKIAKAFHLEVDEKGMPKKDFNAEELLENTKKQGKNLSDRLIEMKKTVKEKLENIKLLDANDTVSKAYKSLNRNKMALGIGTAGISALALLYLLKDNTKEHLYRR